MLVAVKGGRGEGEGEGGGEGGREGGREVERGGRGEGRRGRSILLILGFHTGFIAGDGNHV